MQRCCETELIEDMHSEEGSWWGGKPWALVCWCVSDPCMLHTGADKTLVYIATIWERKKNFDGNNTEWPAPKLHLLVRLSLRILLQWNRLQSGGWRRCPKVLWSDALVLKGENIQEPRHYVVMEVRTENSSCMHRQQGKLLQLVRKKNWCLLLRQRLLIGRR